MALINSPTKSPGFVQQNVKMGGKKWSDPWNLSLLFLFSCELGEPPEDAEPLFLSMLRKNLFLEIVSCEKEETSDNLSLIFCVNGPKQSPKIEWIHYQSSACADYQNNELILWRKRLISTNICSSPSYFTALQPILIFLHGLAPSSYSTFLNYYSSVCFSTLNQLCHMRPAEIKTNPIPNHCQSKRATTVTIPQAAIPVLPGHSSVSSLNLVVHDKDGKWMDNYP